MNRLPMLPIPLLKPLRWLLAPVTKLRRLLPTPLLLLPTPLPFRLTLPPLRPTARPPTTLPTLPRTWLTLPKLLLTLPKKLSTSNTGQATSDVEEAVGSPTAFSLWLSCFCGPQRQKWSSHDFGSAS